MSHAACAERKLFSFPEPNFYVQWSPWLKQLQPTATLKAITTMSVLLLKRMEEKLDLDQFFPLCYLHFLYKLFLITIRVVIESSA